MLIDQVKAQIFIFVVSCLLYSNTLFAGFTFDDNYAIVSLKHKALAARPCLKEQQIISVRFWLIMQINNEDVTRESLFGLGFLKHDFW